MSKLSSVICNLKFINNYELNMHPKKKKKSNFLVLATSKNKKRRKREKEKKREIPPKMPKTLHLFLIDKPSSHL